MTLDELKTGGDVIDAMIRGLEAEHLPVRMDAYLRPIDGELCGCAAENFICEVTGRVPKRSMPLCVDRAEFFGIEEQKFTIMEGAIDCLRYGWIDDYNHLAKIARLPSIHNPDKIDLPELTTKTWRENLEPYRRLADANR